MPTVDQRYELAQSPDQESKGSEKIDLHIDVLLKSLNHETSSLLEAGRAFTNHCQQKTDLSIDRILIFANTGSFEDSLVLDELHQVVPKDDFLHCVFSSNNDEPKCNKPGETSSPEVKEFKLPLCPARNCILFRKADLAKSALYFDPNRLSNLIVHDPTLWHLLYPIELDHSKDPWSQLPVELEPVPLKTECLVVPIFSHKIIVGFVYFENEHSGGVSQLSRVKPELMSLCELLGPIIHLFLCQVKHEVAQITSPVVDGSGFPSFKHHFLPVCDMFSSESRASLLKKKAWCNVRDRMYLDEIQNLEQQLTIAHEKYDSLLNLLPNNTFVIDEYGLMCDYGQNGLDFVGLPLDQMLGYGWLKTIHPDDRRSTMMMWRESLNKSKNYAIEHRIRAKDGVFHYFLSQGQFNERTRRWYGNSVDIGKFKQAYALARQRESMLQTLLRYVPSMIWTATKTGDIDYFNPVFTKYTGKKCEDFLGTRWIELTNPSDVDGLRDSLSRIFKSEKSGSHEHRILAKSGEYRWFNTKLVPLRDDSSNIYKWVGMCVDIDEPKTAMLSALRSREMQSNFFSNMSHELRTPFAGVLGNLELLQGTELTFEQADLVEAAKVSTERLLGVINDILNFSKLEAGKVSLESIPFSLEDVFEDLFELLTPLVTDRNLQFYAWVDPQVPSIVVGDCNRLRQVLLNLVGNSIKFCEQGKIRVRAFLAAPDIMNALVVAPPSSFDSSALDGLRETEHDDSCSTASSNGHQLYTSAATTLDNHSRPNTANRAVPDVFSHVNPHSIAFSETRLSSDKYALPSDNNVTIVFEIFDTGIGMTQAEMLSLFEPFMQADCSTTRLYGGTGLGLSICAALIDLMNGKLQCFSVKNVGTVFRFSCQFAANYVPDKCNSGIDSSNMLNSSSRQDDYESCEAVSSSDGGSSVVKSHEHYISRTQQLEQCILLETALLPATAETYGDIDKEFRMANSRTLLRSLTVWIVSLDEVFMEMLCAFTNKFSTVAFSSWVLFEQELFGGSNVDMIIIDIGGAAGDLWRSTQSKMDHLGSGRENLKILLCASQSDISRGSQSKNDVTSKLSESKAHRLLSAARFLVQCKTDGSVGDYSDSDRHTCQSVVSDKDESSDIATDVGLSQVSVFHLVKPIWKRKLMKAMISTQRRKVVTLSSQGTPLFSEQAFDSATDNTMRKGSAEVLPEGSSADKSLRFSGLHALIAEDNMISQTLLTKQLEKLGVTAAAVENGEIAIKLFSSHEPGYFDLFFCDFHMPLVDGVEATRRIRHLERERYCSVTLPIIGLTADIQKDVQEKCQKAGMNSVLVKPMTISKLENVLESLFSESDVKLAAEKKRQFA